MARYAYVLAWRPGQADALYEIDDNEATLGSDKRGSRAIAFNMKLEDAQRVVATLNAEDERTKSTT